MSRIVGLLLLLALLAAPGAAGAAGGGEGEGGSVLFRALGDELQRSMKRLKLGDNDGPYYVAYAVEDVRSIVYRGSFGALVEKGDYRKRRLYVDVRTGSYDLDSTNFVGDLPLREQFSLAIRGGQPASEGTTLTSEDDYDAIRNAIWGRTDDAYKTAVERLGKKKGFLAARNTPDRLPDFSREDVVVAMEAEARLASDAKRWAAAVRRLSALFRGKPAVERSLVVFRADARNRWFVNSEGSRSLRADVSAHLALLALGRTPDGSIVTDSEIVAGRGDADFPSDKALEGAVDSLAARIEQLAAAPPAEPYSGPVLFEAPAAAELVHRGLAPYLGNGHSPVGEPELLASLGNPFRSLVGRRVLPAFLSVEDDPTAAEFRGVPLLCRRTLDDDGLVARKVSLVERGMLREFCASRVPSSPRLRSNGHSRSGIGRADAVFVSTSEALTPEDLRKRLLELGREEGLSRVRIVRRIASPWGAEMDPPSPDSASTRSRGEASFVLPPPAALYEVSVADGTERLVRGARFAPATPRLFREIQAAGDDSRALVVLRGTTEATHVATPSLLVREMELLGPDKAREEPPVLPHPVFGDSATPR